MARPFAFPPISLDAVGTCNSPHSLDHATHGPALALGALESQDIASSAMLYKVFQAESAAKSIEEALRWMDGAEQNDYHFVDARLTKNSATTYTTLLCYTGSQNEAESNLSPIISASACAALNK